MRTHLINQLFEISIIKKNKRPNSPDSFFSKTDDQLFTSPNPKMIKDQKSINS